MFLEALLIGSPTREGGIKSGKRVESESLIKGGSKGGENHPGTPRPPTHRKENASITTQSSNQGVWSKRLQD